MNTDHKIFDTKIAEFFFMATIIPIAAIGFFASDIYLPSFLPLEITFNNSNLDVQLTMSIFLIAMAISQVFIGTLSDKIGRKPVLLCFLFIFIVASFGCFHAQSLNELIFFRFVQGIGAASGMTISQAIVSDLYGPVHSAKPLSIIIPLVAFSPAIAPILGGFIEEMSNWKNIFFFLSFLRNCYFHLVIDTYYSKIKCTKSTSQISRR
jgi:MFS transporter, DHA1 family, multidrug resistance protein